MDSTDDMLAQYMRESSVDFWLSSLMHLIGWLAGGLEVWIILACMGVYIDLGTAIVVVEWPAPLSKIGIHSLPD